MSRLIVGLALVWIIATAWLVYGLTMMGAA